jgi:hypothetical protein
MIAVRAGGTFLAIAAARQAAAQSGPFSSSRVAEAAAALVTGTLAVLVWLRSRQAATFQLAAGPADPVPGSMRSAMVLPTSTSTSLVSEPGSAACSMLRRLGTAVLFGLTAGFLAPGPVAAAVFAAAGFGCGYVVAGRSAAAKAAKAVQQRLAAAPPAIELFAAGLAAGILPEQAANAVVDAFGRPGPATDPRWDRDPRTDSRSSDPCRPGHPGRGPARSPRPGPISGGQSSGTSGPVLPARLRPDRHRAHCAGPAPAVPALKSNRNHRTRREPPDEHPIEGER